MVIEFSSAKFLPYLPEECQSNPGAYGFELALWLSQALMKAGLPTSYPMGEDWGWFIEYFQDDAEVIIGCGALASEGEGYTGQPVMWRVFIQQRLSFIQRLKGVTVTSDLVVKLAEAIAAGLRSEDIQPVVKQVGFITKLF